MKIYIDTSVLVSALTEEAETTRTQQWLHDQEPDTLLISEWVASEFSAALSIKVRNRKIEADMRDRALTAFRRLSAEVFEVLPVRSLHFQRSAHFADQDALGLRAGDALHLAIASDCEALLCTLDRRLAEAGLRLGLKTQLL
ncbi:Predicted nucleic acid-binding protein, contains PIN domain [Bosea lathyri]|uniref:Ribonuclease VapC n=1 Tax=Bosea lathyri TaxID=1036778 RepID=A0A1H6BM86_9HYPH|nr:Predicted nucleic acid-binding protein, contains PIN domain [Bosea lathyri]